MIFEISIVIISLLISRLLFQYHGIEGYEPTPTQSDFTPAPNHKHIFCFWNSDRMPRLVSACIKKMQSSLPEWKLIMLTDSTIGRLVPAEELPRNFDVIHVQGRSDFYRLYLINRYGGLYMDATIVLNDPAEIEGIYEQVVKHKRPFVFELRGHRFKAEGKTYPGVENWLIMAPPSDTFVRLWFEEFRDAIAEGLFAYSRRVWAKYAFSDSVVSQPSNLYHSSYKCAQVVMQRHKIGYEYILTKDARDTMYKYLGECSRANLIPRVPTNIKLTSHDRRSIEGFYELFMRTYFASE